MWLKNPTVYNTNLAVTQAATVAAASAATTAPASGMYLNIWFFSLDKLLRLMIVWTKSYHCEIPNKVFTAFDKVFDIYLMRGLQKYARFFFHGGFLRCT